MAKKLWSPDWSKAPKDAIGAAFNPDGRAWWWNVLPEVKGSDEKPWLLLWRGPVAREGFSPAGKIPDDVDKSQWKDSWLDRPKGK